MEPGTPRAAFAVLFFASITATPDPSGPSLDADHEIGPWPDAPTAAGLPRAIRLLYGDAAGEMTVVWASASDAASGVRYRPILDADPGRHGKGHAWGRGAPGEVAAERWDFPSAWYRSTAEPEDGDFLSYDGIVHGASAVHSVRLAGLESGTAYEFQVGSDAGGWSVARTFRTASEDAERVVLTAYGDSGTGLEPSLAARRAAAAAPDFHLHLGDIAYPDRSRPLTEAWWTQWFEEQAPLLERGPYMPAMGNHDRDSRNGTAWPHVRLFPVDGPLPPAWSFRHGPVAVVSIWSDSENHRPRTGMLEFLDRELARHENATWKIVTMHAGAYSTGPHGSACRLRPAIEPVLAAHGVDLVLAGHDHGYERTYPVHDGIVSGTPVAPDVFEQGSGVVHVVAGTGGAKPYPYTDAPVDTCGGPSAPASWSAARRNAVGAVVVRADLDGLRLEFVEAASGAVLDSFALVARPTP